MMLRQMMRRGAYFSQRPPALIRPFSPAPTRPIFLESLICHPNMRFPIRRFVHQGNTRLFSSVPSETSRGKAGDLAKHQQPPHAVMLVKQAAKTSVNFVFVAGCLTLTGAILYAIGDALFGSTSPYKVLSSSLEIIKKDEEINRTFGEPIRAYCDGHRRRNQLASVEEKIDGVPHVRINYHIEGPLAKGDVYVEVKKSGSDYDYNYIVVNPPRRRPIHVIDNRRSS